MKKTFLTIAAFTLLTSTAFAGNGPICYPPVEVQAETVSRQIAQKVIDQFCEQADPVSTTPGTIILYYDYNAAGECVAFVKVVK